MASGESLKEPMAEELCASCSKIPFEYIFQVPPDEGAFQYRLDDLGVLRQRESACRFCQFLTSIYEYIFSPYFKDVGHVPSLQNSLYLVSNSSRKPWFDMVGITAPDLPEVPIAWLQLKHDEFETAPLSEPYVCISRLPDIPSHADEAHSKIQYALPRKRLPDEARSGSIN
jgi:hypothetical protein